jgi:hypothetical protein
VWCENQNYVIFVKKPTPGTSVRSGFRHLSKIGIIEELNSCKSVNMSMVILDLNYGKSLMLIANHYINGQWIAGPGATAAELDDGNAVALRGVGRLCAKP